MYCGWCWFVCLHGNPLEVETGLYSCWVLGLGEDLKHLSISPLERKKNCGKTAASFQGRHSGSCRRGCCWHTACQRDQAGTWPPGPGGVGVEGEGWGGGGGGGGGGGRGGGADGRKGGEGEDGRRG